MLPIEEERVNHSFRGWDCLPKQFSFAKKSSELGGTGELVELWSAKSSRKRYAHMDSLDRHFGNIEGIFNISGYFSHSG